MIKIKYAIIGSGVVGTAIAKELSGRFGDEVFVFERNPTLHNDNQSTRNSGVIHAGIYYSKATQPNKARFCVEGNSMLYDFCKKHNVPHENTGKLLVATNPREAQYLDDVLKTATENGVPVKMIDASEAKKMEPDVHCTQALYVPTSGIVDPFILIGALYHLASKNGANFAADRKIVGIKPFKNRFIVSMQRSSMYNDEEFEAENLINCAGLYSDEIAKMVNPDSPFVMNPTKGQAVKFYKKPNLGNRMNVYPAPHGFYVSNKQKADIPFDEFQQLLKKGVVKKTVGVHLTPTFDLVDNNYVIGSTVTIGPLLSPAKHKEDYAFDADVSKFYERVKAFFQNIKLEDLSPHQAGILAQIMKQEGSELKPYNDFVIERDQKHPNCVNLIGIDSPGLTSSLAIAKYMSSMFK